MFKKQILKRGQKIAFVNSQRKNLALGRLPSVSATDLAKVMYQTEGQESACRAHANGTRDIAHRDPTAWL